MSVRDMAYSFDSPIVYKGLKINPIRMKDYYEFMFLSDCLMQEKNSIIGLDPMVAMKAISMTYFEYIFSVSNKENLLREKFDALLKLVLGKTNDELKIHYWFEEKDGRPYFKIEGTTYDSFDVDELRKIIAEQNYLDLPNEIMNKKTRDKLEEARRITQKIHNTKTASLEEQMIAISLFTGWRIEEIYELAIRKFFLMIRRANHMVMSEIYLNASMSGFVTFKDKSVLKGWLTDLEVEDKYSDVKLDPEAISKKINFEDAKKK